MAEGNKEPLVSVLILNFNGESYLKQCLISVLNTNYPNFEVILIDNASTDNSVRMVQETFGMDKRLRILKSDRNLGFSAGNNFGFNYAKGDYVIFLNNDTITDSNWITRLIDALETDKTIGLAGSEILSIDGRKLRGGGGLWSDYLLFLCPIGAGKESSFEFMPTFEVSYASGCSMIASREFLEQIGLFDSKVPFMYDDNLMGLKTWLSGKRVVTVSNSKVCHIGGATTTKYWDNYLATFSHLRAKMCLTFDVYFNLRDLSKALLVIHLSIVIDSLLALKMKKLPAFSANIHASAWLIKNLKYVWNNRLEHWSKAKISPELLISKFIRIRLRFPLCIIPSKTRGLLYQAECLKYEKEISFSNKN